MSKIRTIIRLHTQARLSQRVISLHAGTARAVATLLLEDSTLLDLSEVIGRPAKLDVAVLDAGRLARGEQLKFELRDTIVG